MKKTMTKQNSPEGAKNAKSGGIHPIIICRMHACTEYMAEKMEEEMDKYPYEMTPEQFDAIYWKQTRQIDTHDANYVEHIAEKTPGSVVYTQVDTDDGIAYLKGIHTVNRTGIYEVVTR